MSKDKSKKICLEDLINRRTQGKLDKFQIKFFDSKELGGQLEIHKIPLKKYTAMLNDADTEDVQSNLDFMSKLIYECCPIIKENSKELMKVYKEAAEPFELPVKILNDNMGELNKITEIINSFYGLSNVDEDIKN